MQNKAFRIRRALQEAHKHLSKHENHVDYITMTNNMVRALTGCVIEEVIITNSQGQAFVSYQYQDSQEYIEFMSLVTMKQE